jgi:hypothetical protein
LKAITSLTGEVKTRSSSDEQAPADLRINLNGCVTAHATGCSFNACQVRASNRAEFQQQSIFVADASEPEQCVSQPLKAASQFVKLVFVGKFSVALHDLLSFG